MAGHQAVLAFGFLFSAFCNSDHNKMHVLSASHPNLQMVPRSQTSVAPAAHIAAARQPACTAWTLQPCPRRFCRRPHHAGHRRSSKLVSRDSASSTWPSEPAEALTPAEPQTDSSPADNGNGAAKKTIEQTSDKAATRVGLSSKGSNKIAGFWRAYSKALEEHPIRVKSATSFFGFLAGDAVAQLVVGNPYNYLRTLRMVIFGILMDGPIGQYSFAVMSTCQQLHCVLTT